MRCADALGHGTERTIAGVRPPELPGVTHDWVDAGGLRTHVALAGEVGEVGAPPLVLLHGWPEHWYAWRKVIPALAQQYRVIVPDLRGLGWTDAPRDGYGKEQLARDLLALLDALGLERVRLVGHDWGGVVSWLVACRHPDRIHRLMLVNTGHGWLSPSLAALPALAGFWYMPLIGAPGLGPRLVRSERFRRTLERWLDPGEQAWDAEAREAFAAPLREPARALATQRIYGTWWYREILPITLGRYADLRLRVPTLFLHGDQDRAIRPAILGGWEGKADDFRLELLPGLGHFPFEEAPDLLAGKMLDFLGAPA
jgi:pimeloyl-ACP methyl ester carboxylesterase